MIAKRFLIPLMACASLAFAAMPSSKSLNKSLQDFMESTGQELSPFSSLSGKALKLGTPISIWKITQETAKAYSETKYVPDLYSDPSTVLVPVLDEGTIILFLRLQSSGNDEWQTTGMGFGHLAKEVEQLEFSWPTNKYEWILVENEVTREHLFSILTGQEANLNRFRFNDEMPIFDGEDQVAKYYYLEKTETEVARFLELVRDSK